MKRGAIALLSVVLTAFCSTAQTQLIKYGDFENWVTRNIKESKIIGGKLRQVYEIAPTAVIDKTAPYHNMGGSQWATSNVYADVMGVVKTSNTVYPDNNPAGGKCCKMM